jgi:hypothetical protein
MPLIELNHIFVVLGRSTYNGIRNADFMKEFAYSSEKKWRGWKKPYGNY